MPLLVTFRQDTEADGVGTLVVTDSADPAFRVEDRVDTNDPKAVDAFVAAVKARRSAVDADAGKARDVAGKIEAVLNG